MNVVSLLTATMLPEKNLKIVIFLQTVTLFYIMSVDSTAQLKTRLTEIVLIPTWADSQRQKQLMQSLENLKEFILQMFMETRPPDRHL